MSGYRCWGCGWEGDHTVSCCCPNCGASDYIAESAPEPYCNHAGTMGYRDCVHCSPPESARGDE